MLLLFRLAIKNIASHFVQSFITIFGIALSIATILAVSSADQAIFSSVLKTIAELGTGKTDIWLQATQENNPVAGSRDEGFNQELAIQIARNPAVASVHPLLKIKTTGCNDDREKEFFLYGVDLLNDMVVRKHIIQNGNYAQGKNEIIIGEKLALDLGLDVNSAIYIKTKEGMVPLIITGLLKADTGSGMLHYNNVGFTDLSTVQQNFDYQERISALNIVLKSNYNIAEVANEIESLLPFNIVLYTDQLAVSAENDQTKQLRVSSFIFSLISIFLAIFIIYNTLATRIEQNKKEIALLRLIGMTQQEVIFYFLMQAGCYAFIACILGLGLGLVMGSGLLYLVSLLVKFQTMFFVFPSLVQVLSACAIGIITTVVVGIFPALRAAQTSAQALFRTAQSANQINTSLTIKAFIGLVFIITNIIAAIIPIEDNLFTYIKLSSMLLLFIGIVMVSDFLIPRILRLLEIIGQKAMGIPGLIALKTLKQKLKRTIITIVAITITVGIITGFMGMTDNIKTTVHSWLDKTGWADLIIFSNTGAELNESLISELKQYHIIQQINPLRYLFIPYEHESLSDDGFMFQACNIKNFFSFTGIEVLEGNTENIIAQMENNPLSILVNENLAKKLELKQGDSLALETKTGKKDFLIGGTIRDYTDFIHRMGKVVYGSTEALARFWEVQGYTLVQIHLTETMKMDQARNIIANDLKENHNLKIITHAEEKEEVGASIDAVFSIFYIINWILFIIVFLAIFQTMLINVLFQIYEFAVLRVLGCFNRQIKRIILGQALLLSIVGGILAVLCGAWLSSQFTQGAGTAMGYITCYFPLLIMTALLTVCIVAAIIATLYPRRLATGFSLTRIMQSIDQI